MGRGREGRRGERVRAHPPKGRDRRRGKGMGR